MKIINGKNPDFINVNGQKKIVEMFGTYWHGESRTGLPNEVHVQERKDIFKEYGYETLIVWQHELVNSDFVLNKLQEFHNV